MQTNLLSIEWICVMTTILFAHILSICMELIDREKRIKMILCLITTERSGLIIKNEAEHRVENRKFTENL